MSKKRKPEDGAGVAEAVAREPEKLPDGVRSALVKLRTMWLTTQPATHSNATGSVSLTRDEAAALYEHIQGQEPA